MKKFLFILLLLNLSYSNVYSLEADVFVQSTVNRASDILSKSISKEEKIDRLKSIAKETVDITGVGFYSLGPARNELSAEQKKEYFFVMADSFVLMHKFNKMMELHSKRLFHAKATLE